MRTSPIPNPSLFMTNPPPKTCDNIVWSFASFDMGPRKKARTSTTGDAGPVSNVKDVDVPALGVARPRPLHSHRTARRSPIIVWTPLPTPTRTLTVQGSCLSQPFFSRPPEWACHVHTKDLSTFQMAILEQLDLMDKSKKPESVAGLPWPIMNGGSFADFAQRAQAGGTNTAGHKCVGHARSCRCQNRKSPQVCRRSDGETAVCEQMQR